MAEHAPIKMWMMRFLFCFLVAICMFVLLLPLQTIPKGWAGPDLIIALSFVWVLRRPEFVPLPLLALIFLLSDLIFQRPPGLWAALALLAAESLRQRASGLRDQTFWSEWLTVTSFLILLTLSYRLCLAMVFVEQAPLGLSLIHLMMTIIVYPVVAFVSAIFFGVRKPAPGDFDTLGGRA
ncbi:MAG: rod shape-determining protein MreD [Pseudomonadota bacterium]